MAAIDSPTDRFNARVADMEQRERRRRRGRRLLIVMMPFLAITLFLAVTSVVGETARQQVIDAASAWAENEPERYEMRYAIRVDGALVGHAVVQVEDQALVGYEPDAPVLEDHRIYTVAATFFAIEEVALSGNGEVVDVDYDEELGFATFVRLDPDTRIDGDEWTLEVLEFTAG